MPDPDVTQILHRLGIAVALGLLVGLQREHAGSRNAGIRTFALITVFGCLAGLLAATLGPWLAGAALLGLGALLAVSRFATPKPAEAEPGLTSEVAALVMFAIGLWLAQGPITPAVVTTGAVLVLLQWKDPLHAWAKRISPEDIAAIARFVLISLVILPLLPDHDYGPYQGTLNPRETWLMVVLIVGIGLGGWALGKLFGERAGTLLGGVLGGLVSSTATTVSFARRARESGGEPAVLDQAGLVILVACAISNLRILVLVCVFAPSHIATTAAPLGVFAAVMVLATAALLVLRRQPGSAMPPTKNPAEVGPALIFGALYAGIGLLAAWANGLLGQAGLYTVALVSGATDMDAITLSTSRLLEHGDLPAAVAWHGVVIAAIANLVFKGLAAASIGGRGLAWRVNVVFAITGLAGVGLLLFWP